MKFSLGPRVVSERQISMKSRREQRKESGKRRKVAKVHRNFTGKHTSESQALRLHTIFPPLGLRGCVVLPIVVSGGSCCRPFIASCLWSGKSEVKFVFEKTHVGLLG